MPEFKGAFVNPYNAKELEVVFTYKQAELEAFQAHLKEVCFSSAYKFIGLGGEQGAPTSFLFQRKDDADMTSGDIAEVKKILHRMNKSSTVPPKKSAPNRSGALLFAEIPSDQP